MKTLQRTIVVNDTSSVSSVWIVPPNYQRDRSSALILAHGAGNDMHNPFLSFMHDQLAQRGLLTVKFNFPYKERGRKAPDRPPILEATWNAVVKAVREDGGLTPARVFFSGKSMGGRIASLLAAAGEECAGLVFFGYPLHPPNKPNKPKTEHLSRIACPILFVQGSRDALCKLDLLQDALEAIKGPVSLTVIEGGDHSYKVLKRDRRSQQEVWKEVLEHVWKWLTPLI